MESRAFQRWRIVKANFVPSEFPQAQVEQSSKRTAALQRWRLLQRTFLPEITSTSSPTGNTEPSIPRSTSNNTTTTTTSTTNTNSGPRPLPSSHSSSQRLRAITAHRSVQREKVESYVRNVSVTDIDSPYRAALSDLADLDWQYSETERKTPCPPTIPQFSTVHYHPNHEAFYDEETGFPVPKSSTMSIKRAGTHSTALLFERSTVFPYVDEDGSRKYGVQPSRRKRMASIRLGNLRISVLQTMGRCIRRCLHPDVRL